MSVAWYWPSWGCSDPPEESCADAGCPVHGDVAQNRMADDDEAGEPDA